MPTNDYIDQRRGSTGEAVDLDLGTNEAVFKFDYAGVSLTKSGSTSLIYQRSLARPIGDVSVLGAN